MCSMVRPDMERETAGNVALPAIHLQVEERLRRSPYPALQNVLCHGGDGVIYLHGRLPSYYLKQIAQELAGGAVGVRTVVNQIEVSAPSGQARAGRATRPTRLEDRSRATKSVGGEETSASTHDLREEFATMLVLSRKRNEAIVINGDIRIIVVASHGNQVRLGVEAPDSVKIVREELRDRADWAVQPGSRGPRLGKDRPRGTSRPGRRGGAACEGIAAGLLTGHAKD
jgi:carbon storage regulator CsrA